MNRMLLLLFFAFTSFSVQAQDMGKVRGVVVDAETGESLIGANVVIKDETGKPAYGTATDLDIDESRLVFRCGRCAEARHGHHGCGRQIRVRARFGRAIQ